MELFGAPGERRHRRHCPESPEVTDRVGLLDRDGQGAEVMGCQRSKKPGEFLRERHALRVRANNLDVWVVEA